ncbi:MAG TPA: intradiol ring-cleavage dioxygenase [Thermoanaerobaculia bacterium]
MSRRRMMQALLGAGAVVLGGGAAGLAWLDQRLTSKNPVKDPLPEGSGAARSLPLTPACNDGDEEPTPSVIEGPFYKPNSPQRTVLREADTVGTPLVIKGRVLSPDCVPIAGAVLDFWSCDGKGVYDNEGFRLRGHQLTDAAGVFRVETVKPSDYKDFGIHRTPHVHVRAQGPRTGLLTTQLFFPGEPLNAQDWLLKESLIMNVARSGDESLVARFDFVLA